MNFFKQFNSQLSSAIAEAKTQLSEKIVYIPSGRGYTDDYVTTLLIQLLQILVLLPYGNSLLHKYAIIFGVDESLFRAGIRMALGKHGNNPIQPDIDGLNEILAVMAQHFGVIAVPITVEEWHSHQKRMQLREQGL